jgi:AraC family transcriptional regulator of adaptative response/methylated-DNA-[protein]-cysteine methyltransferase
MQRAALERGWVSRRVDLVNEVCHYIKENSTTKISLGGLGKRFGVSPYHLQRVFTDVMGISPRRYLEECRLSVLKLRLAKGGPVLDAVRGTGYSSQSWLYGDSRRRLGMTPATYRNGGSGALVMYATGSCPIGRLLVAATSHGICSVNVGVNDRELEVALRSEYRNATIVKSDKLNDLLYGVKRHLSGQRARLPLDIRGTDFQLKVWAALQRIPLGETRSYSEVAEMMGAPLAVRAVANACASNPIPLIVPCHRVIKKDGSLGGYGLGLPLKRALLSSERALAAKKQAR